MLIGRHGVLDVVLHTFQETFTRKLSSRSRGRVLVWLANRTHPAMGAV